MKTLVLGLAIASTVGCKKPENNKPAPQVENTADKAAPAPDPAKGAQNAADPASPAAQPAAPVSLDPVALGDLQRNLDAARVAVQKATNDTERAAAQAKLDALKAQLAATVAAAKAKAVPR
jgi:hypothetical protein